jgi:hypothetical protein
VLYVYSAVERISGGRKRIDMNETPGRPGGSPTPPVPYSRNNALKPSISSPAHNGYDTIVTLEQAAGIGPHRSLKIDHPVTEPRFQKERGVPGISGIGDTGSGETRPERFPKMPADNEIPEAAETYHQYRSRPGGKPPSIAPRSHAAQKMPITTPTDARAREPGWGLR